MSNPNVAPRLPIIYKHPSDDLDYGFDYQNLFQQGETINTSLWTIDPDLGSHNPGFVGSISVIWLTGGTLDNNNVITNTVTTNQSRTFVKSMIISVTDKR